MYKSCDSIEACILRVLTKLTVTMQQSSQVES